MYEKIPKNDNVIDQKIYRNPQKGPHNYQKLPNN